MRRLYKPSSNNLALLGAAAAFLALSALTPSSATAKVAAYSCKESSCEYEYRLNRSATVEFRGNCEFDGVKYAAFGAPIEKTRAITCASDVIFNKGYLGRMYPFVSKQCTNWSPVNRNVIKLRLSCFN